MKYPVVVSVSREFQNQYLPNWGTECVTSRETFKLDSSICQTKDFKCVTTSETFKVGKGIF